MGFCEQVISVCIKLCSSECGLWTSSLGLTQIKHATSRPHLRPRESEPAFLQDPQVMDMKVNIGEMLIYVSGI